MSVATVAWPFLKRVRVDGFRKADAARWKACFAGVATVELRKGKTDARLAANFGNPFREWVDRSPVIARAATGACRKARSAIGEGVSKKEAEKILRTMVEAFNALDDKHGLDTVDCEEIGEAFFQLASDAGVTEDDATDWFDRWRNF